MSNKDIELYIYFGWKCDDRHPVDQKDTLVKNTNNPDNTASKILFNI